MGQLVRADRRIALGQPHQQRHVVRVPCGEWGEDRVGGQRVLDVAQREQLLLAGQHIAEVPHVGPVGEHVRHPEPLPRLGVRVAGHAHGEPLAAQVVRARPAFPHAFHPPLGVAQRDELLQQLRRGVLDVVEVQQHVVAHLQREGDLLDLLSRGGVGRLGRVDRGDRTTQRRPVDLHEDQAQPAGHVLHQRRLAVAGRRDEQQQPGLVGAPGVARGTELLGQIVRDERQVDLVQQPVADERAHHPRLVLRQPQPLPLARHQFVALALVGPEPRHPLGAEPPGPGEQLVEAELQAPPGDPGVGAEQTLHSGRQRGRGVVPGQVGAAQDDRHRLGQVRVGTRQEGPEPRRDQLVAGGQVVPQRAQVLLELPAGLRSGTAEGAVEPVEQRPRAGAGDEAGRSRGQLLEQVLPGKVEIGQLAGEAGAGSEGDHRLGELGCQRRDGLLAGVPGLAGRRGPAERHPGPGQRSGARGPPRPGRLVGAVRPEQLGRGACRGRIAQQAGAGSHSVQGGQDQVRVVVVHAALVPLVVPGLGGPPNQILGVRLVEQRGGQVLGAVDLGRLGDQQLLPEGLRLLERRIAHRRPVVGGGDRECHPAVQRRRVGRACRAAGREDHGEVDRLGVHCEGVPAEADRLAAVRVQVEPVAQGAASLLARGLELAGQLLSANLVAQGAQLVGDAAYLRHHRVGGEVGVHLVQRAQRAEPAANGGHDPLGRVDQPVRPAGPLVQQRLLARGERLVDIGTLGAQLGEEVVELAEPGLQVFQLEHQPAKLLVAALRRVGDRQRAGYRLAEQGELGGERGPALDRGQLPAPSVQYGPCLVHRGQHLADPFQDRGAHRGVGDLQRADHLGDHLQPAGLLGQALGHRRGRRHGRDRPGLGLQPRDLGVVAGEGVVPTQEPDRPLRRLVHLGLQRGGELIDAGDVHVAQLAQGDQAALRLAQLGELPHPAVRTLRRLAARPPDQGRDLLRRLVQRGGRPRGQLLDLLELVQYLAGRGLDFGQR